MSVLVSLLALAKVLGSMKLLPSGKQRAEGPRRSACCPVPRSRGPPNGSPCHCRPSNCPGGHGTSQNLHLQDLPGDWKDKGHTNPGTTPIRFRSYQKVPMHWAISIPPHASENSNFCHTTHIVRSGCNWDRLPNRTVWWFPPGRHTPIPPRSGAEMYPGPIGSISG